MGELLEDHPTETKEHYDSSLNAAIKTSIERTDADLDKRLSAAAKRPEKVLVTSLQHRRNPDVIERVRRRAGGICEKCGNKAPFFRRSDGSPYLEIHHVIPLSEDGDDTASNVAALCPNCHREVHYGKDTTINFRA